MSVSVRMNGGYRLYSPEDVQDLARSIMNDYDARMNDYDTRPYVYADENWRNDPTYNMRVRK